MSDSVPAIAYGFVGLTALVLTYATLADNEGKSDEAAPSSTSMLPAVGLTQPPQPTLGETESPATEEESESAQEAPPQEGQPAYGGKKRKTKGGKKSKMKKEKHVEKKKKHTRRNPKSKA